MNTTAGFGMLYVCARMRLNVLVSAPAIFRLYNIPQKEQSHQVIYGNIFDNKSEMTAYCVCADIPTK
jgi:hypothetical protein